MIFHRLSPMVGLTAHRCLGLVRSLTRPRDGNPDHIAVLCDTFHRYGMAQAVGLASSGLRVTCFYVDRMTDFGNCPEDRQALVDWARGHGVEMVPLPRRNMLRFVQQTRHLHRELRRRRIGRVVVQPHIDPRMATVGLSHWTLFVLHDPQPHSGDSDSRFPAPVRAITRFAELSASALMLHSERLREQLMPSLRRVPCITVPHGANVLPAPLPVPTSERLLIVGRLMAYKGIDTALEALPLVRRTYPGCTMIIAGTGPLGPELLSCEASGVEVRNRYIPEVELQNLMGDATIMLLPYRDATQSGVGLLATAHGLPSIVTDTGALPDLIPPGRGERVVPPGDPQALANAICRVLAGVSMSQREEVLSFARHHFSWKAVGASLHRAFETLDPR